MRRSPPLGRTLRRRIRREVTRSTLLAAIGLLAPILLADLVGLADLMINRGFRVSQILPLVALRLVPALSVAIPPAVLVAGLATLGRMHTHGERTALASCGIAPLRLARPFLGSAFGFCFVVAALTLEAAPWSHRSVNALVAEAAQLNPAATLQSGRVGRFANLRVRAREVSANGDRLSGVAVWLPSIETTAFAKRAVVARGPEGPATVSLEEGVILYPNQSSLTRVEFASLEQPLVPPQEETLAVNTLDATSSQVLWRQAQRAGARAEAGELHRRIASAAAPWVLGCLALALGLGPGSRSRAGGILLALLGLVAYYGVVQLGEGFARNPAFSPALAAWLPNVLLLSVSLALLAVRGTGLKGRARPSSHRPAARRRLRVRPWALERYWLRAFVEITTLCLLGLLLVSLFVDILDNLKWFAKYAAQLEEIGRYYQARVPILLSRVLPLALVTGAGITTGRFAASNELIASRVCGVAPLRTALPIVFVCSLMAGLQHQLANEWVPRFSARASQIKQLEIKNRSAEREAVWFPTDRLLFEVAYLDPLNGLARDVVVYELDAEGLPLSRTETVQARHTGGGVWLLEEPHRMLLAERGLRTVRSERYAQWGEDLTTEVDTGDLTLIALRREIETARRDGYDPRRFQVDYHLRLAAPFACAVLPALILLYANVGPPFPAVSRIVLTGLGLALFHGVGSAATAALAFGGVLPPAAAGWGPLGLLGFGGALWGLRSGAAR